MLIAAETVEKKAAGTEKDTRTETEKDAGAETGRRTEKVFAEKDVKWHIRGKDYCQIFLRDKTVFVLDLREIPSEEKHFLDLKLSTVRGTYQKTYKTAAGMLLAAITLYGGFLAVRSAIPYQGKLSWILSDLRNKRSILLEHDNVYESGIEGILEDVRHKVELPEKLCLATSFNLHFAPDGEIQSFDTMLYGYDKNGNFTDSYLITYPSGSSGKITVYLHGAAEAPYDADKDLQPLFRSLIIEDDELIAELERDYLEANGYETDLAFDGITGEQKAKTEKYDAILLDVMLPGKTGFDVCRELRKSLRLPIIMVTAKKEDIDKIRGLGLGADDYLVKPFSPTELVARVKSHIYIHNLLSSTEEEEQQETEITYRNLTILPKSRRVYLDKKEVILVNKEFELLLFLAENPNLVFSKDTLFDRVWGMDSLGDAATVTVHINRLRDKLGKNESKNQFIETVWGAGYRFRID